MDITPIPSPESFGKFQLVQLLLVGSCHLSVGLRPGSSPGEAKGSGWASVSSSLRGCRAGTPKGMRNKSQAHLGLDAVSCRAQLGVSWGPAPLGGLKGTAVGVCLQLIVLKAAKGGGREDTDWLSVGELGERGSRGLAEGGEGGGGDKEREGGAGGTAYLEGCLQVLGEAGCPGPVLLAALNLLQQSLPGQEREGEGPHSPGLASRPAGSQQGQQGFCGKLPSTPPPRL